MSGLRNSSSWSFNVDKVERWAYWDKAFSDEECDAIVEYGKKFTLHEGTTLGAPSDIRKSNVVFIQPTEENEWVYRRLTDIVVGINSQYFNFDLTGFNEGLQFTEYVAPDGHYDFHVDKIYNQVIRKLSIVLQLTDPETYTGGDFEFNDGPVIEKLSRKKGTLLAFPSYYLHRVTPVTSGIRHSLVGWVSGPQFK
jgi:PKHD-type hydroxylase